MKREINTGYELIDARLNEIREEINGIDISYGRLMQVKTIFEMMLEEFERLYLQRVKLSTTLENAGSNHLQSLGSLMKEL